MVPEGAPRWGWKEPNSHLFLAQLQTHFGDRLRYVHVIRNGFYMAHSANQSQVRRWGARFGIEADLDSPVASLDYWIRSNELAIERGRSMRPGSFFLVNHDQLCESPREEMTSLVDFLGTRPSQVRSSRNSLPSATAQTDLRPRVSGWSRNSERSA